jgi:hypothetical protein
VSPAGRAVAGGKELTHWDVVEVTPGPGYSLYVRIKDGLAGGVQLVKCQFTGALSPHEDESFFE